MNPLQKYVPVHVYAFVCVVKVVDRIFFDCYRNGVVCYESVMALRTKLDELGKMEGIAHAEKSNPLTDTVHVH